MGPRLACLIAARVVGSADEVEMTVSGRIGLGWAVVGLLAMASPVVAWDVGVTSQTGQWTVYNRTADASRLGFPLAAGDLNGDGRDDLVLTPMNADSGPQRERDSAGEAVILLGDGTPHLGTAVSLDRVRVWRRQVCRQSRREQYARIWRHRSVDPPDGDAVPVIGAEFHQRALAIANRRVTEAGYRLADLLKRLLREAVPLCCADTR